MLWSSSDIDPDSDFLDKKYSASDVSPEALAQAEADLDSFSEKLEARGLSIYEVCEDDGNDTVRGSDGVERAAFTGRNGEPNLPVEEYLAILNFEREPTSPEFELVPWEQFCDEQDSREEKAYCLPWVEVTKEEWWEALCCLPPEKWRTVSGVEIFRMCERTTGLITAHYAQFGGRYYSANRKVTADYQVLASEIRELALAA